MVVTVDSFSLTLLVILWSSPSRCSSSQWGIPIGLRQSLSSRRFHHASSIFLGRSIMSCYSFIAHCRKDTQMRRNLERTKHRDIERNKPIDTPQYKFYKRHIHGYFDAVWYYYQPVSRCWYYYLYMWYYYLLLCLTYVCFNKNATILSEALWNKQSFRHEKLLQS